MKFFKEPFGTVGASHDFGDMEESQNDSTTFEIWNSGTGTLIWTLLQEKICL